MSNTISSQIKIFKEKYLHIMGNYLVAVLRYRLQQSNPMYILQLTQVILLSIINTVGICQHIAILILYQSSFQSCLYTTVLLPLSVFSAHSFTSTHLCSISEMYATVYTIQITSIKCQNPHYGLLPKQAGHVLPQHTSTT